MSQFKGRRPSASIIVAVVALVAVLGRSAVAGVTISKLNSKEKNQVKKIAKRKAKKLDRRIELQPGPQGEKGETGEPGPPGPATGPAGGDLTGNYPDPTIAPDAVGSNKVADNSLTGSDVNEGTLGKVPDADKLDGVDSTSFLKGESVKGQISVGGPNLTRSYAPLGGVGEVVVTCDTATSPPLAKVRYKNTASGAYGVYIEDSGSGVSKATPNPNSETSILSTSTAPRHVVYRTFSSTVGKAAEWDVFVSTSTSFCFVSVIRTND